MESSHKLHLRVHGQEPIQAGRFGCDFRWNEYYTAYRQAMHRWLPGCAASYAQWQAEDFADDGEA